jgi:trk system potassium uptake protein TrkH
MIEFAGSFWSGCFKALFLSVSAFCNAGIDPLGKGTADFSNLAFFAENPFVLIPVMMLVIVGGLGFIVILDIINRPKKVKKLNLHTKIVLWMTTVLVLIGTLVFMIAEWNNSATIGNMSIVDKITNSFFQSVTTRTAGFATFDQSQMSQMSILFSVFLMFIGGSPMSIAGGIKTTTFFILLLIMIRNQDQNGNIIYKGKKITHKVMTKAIRIALIAATLLLLGSVLIFTFEKGMISVDSVVYEVVSAICTVGLSFGITPTLSVMSKLTLILLMYIGRIGMITIPLAFKFKETSSSIEYVSAKIIVG